MPDIKWGVLFAATGVEKLGEQFGRIGKGFGSVSEHAQELGKNLMESGERLTEWGERLSLTTALMNEGAEKMREWSKEIAEPAMGMERSMATMKAMTNLSDEGYDKLKEHAISFSNTHPGATAEQWVDGFAQMRGAFHDTGKAMDAEDVAGKLNRFVGDAASAAKLITVTNANLGASAKETGDVFLAMTQSFSIVPQDAGQAAMAIGRLAPAAKASHSSIAELYSLIGESTQAMGGGRGANMFASMMNEIITQAGQGKIAGVSFSQGITHGLEQMNSRIAGLSTTDKIAAIKDMHVSNPEMMLTFLGKLGEIEAKEKQLAGAAGTLDKAYATATNNAIDQTALFHQNLASLFDAMYSPALPWLSGAMASLTGWVKSATSASEKHSAITRAAMIGMTVAGTSIYALSQGLSGIGSTAMFAGQAVKFFGLATEALTLKSLGLSRQLTDRRFCAMLLSMMTFDQLMAKFPDEDACREYLMMRRWPNGPVCPRCQKSDFVYNIAKAWKWECSNPDCRSGNAYRFSIIAGTIFENTKKPLLIWFKVLYTMLQSKKGISSRQIRRMFFGESSSVNTAWYMCMRLRAAMHDPDFKQLMGIVEIDEAYLGGDQKNRHAKDRKKFYGRGAAHTGKTTVIGAIARKGNVVCKVIENTSHHTINRFVRKMVSDKVDLIATDSAMAYQWLRVNYNHETVDHKAGEYVRGQIHTNSIESFWALLKRGVMGTFHHVSAKYLPLYLAEFQFRHNHRDNPDIFGEAVRCS